MAQKFIQLEAAAELLGISKDQLSALREKGEAYAYRDGVSWKFKEEEIERLRGELGELLGAAGGSDALELDLDDDFGLGLEPSSGDELELAEDALVLDAPNGDIEEKGPSSTVIGSPEPMSTDTSDVRLADEVDELELAETSDISLDGPTGSSDIELAGEAEQPLAGPTAGSGIAFEDLEELELDLEAESSKILQEIDGGAGKSDVGLSDDALTLDAGSELGLAASDVSLAEEAGQSGGSEIQLADDEDDELVLGESPGGSDITLNTGDSGIGLTAATDSGLSLDEPLELGGSAVETLELGEDEEISLEEEGDSEAATQLKADDDFLLTPLDDAGVDDLDDSGSQVIALDSESFDDAAATMLGSGQPLQEAAALAAAPADMGLGAPGMGMGMGGAAAQPLGATGMVGVAEIPEAPYSIWNVISLVLCFLMLVLTGMMLFDLVRNMWSWDKPYTFNSSLMDALVEALPFFQ